MLKVKTIEVLLEYNLDYLAYTKNFWLNMEKRVLSFFFFYMLITIGMAEITDECKKIGTTIFFVSHFFAYNFHIQYLRYIGLKILLLFYLFVPLFNNWIYYFDDEADDRYCPFVHNYEPHQCIEWVCAETCPLIVPRSATIMYTGCRLGTWCLCCVTGVICDVI